MHVGDENIAERGVFPAGREDRQIFLAGRHDPGILGIDLVEFADGAAANELVHVLVGEVALAFAIGFLPELQHLALDAAHGLFLGDAGVGDAIHAFFAQRQFLGRR